MTITLEDLAGDIRTVLLNDQSAAGKERICAIVSKALRDEAFIAEHLPDRAPGEPPRAVLFEDPDLGFCICGHVYEGPAGGSPHDHGSSWAIYGQATGTTEMTDWDIVTQGSADKPTLVKPARVYTLEPGDAYFYDVHAVHSPNRTGPTRLIRIEGANLDHVQRSNIEAAPSS